MIEKNTHQHRAFYDEHGNVVIENTDPASIQKQIEDDTGMDDVYFAEPAPIESEEKAQKQRQQEVEAVHLPILWTTRSTVYGVLQSITTEGARQYRETWKQSALLSQLSLRSVLKAAKSMYYFLTQPVWIPARRSQRKQYSRIVLFILDTVRFGGTFAALFVFLFVALNYRSFWEISQFYVAPLSSTANTQNDIALQYRLSQKLKVIPALAIAGNPAASFLSFLPPAGPPENRLIIPDIDLNVPIMQPDNAALLAEDWKRLETTIQESLQNGVVHYPGTARPGQAGNFFVTGHSSYFPWAPGKYKSVFARLGELEQGDEYWVYFGGDLHRYRVENKNEIVPSNVSVLDQPVRKRISTLMTCTPVGTTLRRLVVRAQEIDPVSGEPLNVGDRGNTESLPKGKPSELPI